MSARSTIDQNDERFPQEGRALALARIPLSALERIAQILVSVVFFSLYATYVALLYMAKNGFFAYDVFASGSFGMTVFSVTTELQVIIAALLTFGFIGFVPAFQRLVGYTSRRATEPGTRGRFTRVELWLYALVTAGVNAMMLYIIVTNFSADQWFQAVILLLILLSVAIHLLFLFLADTRKIWRSLFGLCFVLIGISTGGKEVLLSLFEQGLKTYGAGGGADIVVKQPGPSEIHGKLVLLAPDNVYMLVAGPNGTESVTAIIPRSAMLGAFITPHQKKK